MHMNDLGMDTGAPCDAMQDAPVWEGGQESSAPGSQIDVPNQQWTVTKLEVSRNVKDELFESKDAEEDAPTPPRASLRTASRNNDDAISESPSPPRRSSPSRDGVNKDVQKDGESGKCPIEPKLKQTGRVAYFSEEKGWGFIQGEGEEQYFVHFSGIAGKGFRKLEKGQNVLFDTEWNAEKNKEQATNVRILLTAAQQGRAAGRDGGHRSRSPRAKDALFGKQQDADGDPLYAAVNDTLTTLFRSEQENDMNLHKKVMQYLKQAVKRTNFDAHVVDIFKNFAEAFFSSLFAAYGDRSWLREAKVDFAWVFDVAAQELFPPELMKKCAEVPDKLRYLLHKAHDKMLDAQRFLNVLHECVKGSRIEGKKTQHKVFDVCSMARDIAITKIKNIHGIDVWKSSEENSFSFGDLECFTKIWIQATVQEAKAKGTQEGSGSEGILNRTNAVHLFDALLKERAFPQIMIRSLEESWPKSPWNFVSKQVLKAFGGDDPLSKRDEPYVAARSSDVRNGKSLPGGLNPKYNAKIQRQQGYGRRRQLLKHVKCEESVLPGPPPSWPPPPNHATSSYPSPPNQTASSSCLPPPPPPPMRQRTAVAVWNGVSTGNVQHYGTDDEQMPQSHSAAPGWWHAPPHNPPSLPPAPDLKPNLHLLVKQERCERESPAWGHLQSKNVLGEIKAPDWGSDDDSEDDYRKSDRSRKHDPMLQPPEPMRKGGAYNLWSSPKGKSYGKGDFAQPPGQHLVKEEQPDANRFAW